MSDNRYEYTEYYIVLNDRYVSAYSSISLNLTKLSDRARMFEDLEEAKKLAKELNGKVHFKTIITETKVGAVIE